MDKYDEKYTRKMKHTRNQDIALYNSETWYRELWQWGKMITNIHMFINDTDWEEELILDYVYRLYEKMAWLFGKELTEDEEYEIFKERLKKYRENIPYELKEIIKL